MIDGPATLPQRGNRARASGHATTFLALAAGIGALAQAALAAAAPARLQDEHACEVALEQAKQQERTGSLLEAKDLLSSCARAPCAEFVRRQCIARHAKLEADTPTVVFVVTDSTGAPRADTQVRVDGVLLDAPLNGHPIEIDPGFHDFAFITGGRVFANQKVLIVQGQRNRFVAAVIGAEVPEKPPADQHAALAEPPVPPLQALPPPAGASPGRTGPRLGPPTRAPTRRAARADGPERGATAGAGEPVPPPAGEEPATGATWRRRLPWALAGAGVLGLGAGALLTSWGRHDNDQLAVCAPACDPANVRHIRFLYRGADVAFGLGIAALAAGYWVYALSHGGDAGQGAGETAVRLDLTPTRDGGLALVSGQF